MPARKKQKLDVLAKNSLWWGIVLTFPSVASELINGFEGEKESTPIQAKVTNTLKGTDWMGIGVTAIVVAVLTGVAMLFKPKN